MVNRMLVVLSALALIITTVGTADAFYYGMPGCVTLGDVVMIPMKVKTTYARNVGGTKGGDSSLLVGGLDWCDQYTGGFRPWGPWRANEVKYKVEVIPPKCVAPAMMGPAGLAAPPCLPPGVKLLCNTESFKLRAFGPMPCVDGGVKYSIEKKQALGIPGPPEKAAPKAKAKKK